MLKQAGFQVFNPNDIPKGPLVSYTTSGISFRKDVVPIGFQYIEFYSDSDRRQIAVKFNRIKTPAAYKLQKTEGSRHYVGRNLWTNLFDEYELDYGHYRLEQHIDLKILKRESDHD